MPHLIVMFSAMLVILAIFIILIRKTALVQNPENRQFARFLLVFVLMTYSYNLYLHYSNSSLYLKVNSLEPVGYFPYLDIRLSNPIANGHYRIDGPVSSLQKHADEFKKEFSPGKSLTSMMSRKDSDNEFGHGNCISVEVMGKKIVSVAWLEKTENETLYVSAHEEMHVIQELHVNEAFEKLKRRFAIKGYDVDFGKFNDEQQAHLAAILIMLERNRSKEAIEMQCSLADEGISTWSKLQEFKKTNSSENRNDG